MAKEAPSITLVPELRREHYNATVSSVRKIHEGLLVLRVRPDSAIAPHWPGQHTKLGLGTWEPPFPGVNEPDWAVDDPPRLIRGTFSLCHPMVDSNGRVIDPASSSARDELEFYLALVRSISAPAAPGLTSRLFMLRSGDRLYVGNRIVGNYRTQGILPHETCLFLSTGTGEAPHNYMLWDLLVRGHHGPIVAACCVRRRADLAYLKAHGVLAEKYRNYLYLPLTTREAEAPKKSAHLQVLLGNGELEGLMGRQLDPCRTHVFLCGNPEMIGIPITDVATAARVYPNSLGVVQVLERRGFRADCAALGFRGNIHFEEYG